jgi:pSer/pThr/pTyr-binding forkhead associated (FHA) protein
MSGVDDGLVLNFDSERDGEHKGDTWVIDMGRREDHDVCLHNDTFVSRDHARLIWRQQRWWLEDRESKNGTFLEDEDEDRPVKGVVPIARGQLFRVGRTWLRIQNGD